MKYTMAFLLLFSGCAVAPVQNPSMMRSGGRSSAAVFQTVLIVPVGDSSFAAVYSPAINPTNFSWSVQSKTNLVQPWTDELGSIDDHGLFNISKRGRKTLFLRLKGTPQ